jgi:putative membrane protein
MDIIIQLLVMAAVLFGLSNIMRDIVVKDYGVAIWVCLLIGILNATIGFLIRLPLNILTLFLLTFFVRLIVSAMMIKLVNKLIKGFEVRSWTAAFIIAIVMAITGSILDRSL